MATLIYLKDHPPSPKRVAAQGNEPAIGTGRILMFTGVRYERYTPETRPTTSGPKSARKR